MVVTPCWRRARAMLSSQISIEPQGRQGKSRAPTRMSWRAGMHGSDPAWCRVKRSASSAKRGEVRGGELAAAVGLEHVPVQAVQQDDHQVLRLLVTHRDLHGGGSPSVWLLHAELAQEAIAEGVELLPAHSTGSGQVHLEVQGDPALLQDEDAVGQQDGLLDVVGDQEHPRLVARAEVGHQRLHLEAGEGVEGGERLVEQEELWLSDQGPGQGDALGLAAREGAGPGVGVALQPDFTERGDGALHGWTTGGAGR